MKLEMRVFNLDVNVELDDDEYYDQLEVLENVKGLIKSLEQFDSVYLHIETVREDEGHEDSQEENEEVAEEEVATEVVEDHAIDSNQYRFPDQAVAMTERAAA